MFVHKTNRASRSSLLTAPLSANSPKTLFATPWSIFTRIYGSSAKVLCKILANWGWVFLAQKILRPESKVSLYSVSTKFTLSAYDIAYLNKYISTLKSKAIVTCIGYYYTKNTTLAKAKALATTQASAVCKLIKKAKPTVITKIVLYPATKAPKAAQGAQWVAVSYRVDSFNAK